MSVPEKEIGNLLAQYIRGGQPGFTNEILSQSALGVGLTGHDNNKGPSVFKGIPNVCHAAYIDFIARCEL